MVAQDAPQSYVIRTLPVLFHVAVLPVSKYGFFFCLTTAARHFASTCSTYKISKFNEERVAGL